MGVAPARQGIGERPMRKDCSPGHELNRRALMACGAAGTLALLTDSASAQRCPATPPARSRGPAVWLDYDQHAMDEMYDQSVFAFNQTSLLARSDAKRSQPRPSASPNDSPMGPPRLKASMSGRPSGRMRRYWFISTAEVGAADARRISLFMPNPISMPARISLPSTSRT